MLNLIIHGERDVQLDRERSEESAARGAESAGERAEAGGDTSSRKLKLTHQAPGGRA